MSIVPPLGAANVQGLVSYPTGKPTSLTDAARSYITIRSVSNGYVLTCSGLWNSNDKEYVAGSVDELCDVLKLALVGSAIDKSLNSGK